MFGLESPGEPTPAPDPVGVWTEFTAFWAESGPSVFWRFVAILTIVVIALLVRWVLAYVIERVVRRIVTGVKRKQDVTDTQALQASPLQASPLQAVRIVQRTRTLGTVLANVVNVTLFIVVVLLIVNVIDNSILGSFALLSAALGAGLGFGAQNIVKDVLNGLFMVVEDQLGVGDIVDLGPATGIVEEVKIRITKIRDVNGTLWFVRNGEILRVGNMSQGWSRVIVDVSVPTGADLQAVEGELMKAAAEFAQTPKWRSRVLEKPELWGLESIAEGAMMLRVVVKVRNSAKDDVAQELRVRLKRAVDALDIEVPKLASVVLEGFDGASRIKGAKPPRTGPSPVAPAPEPKKARRFPRGGDA